MLRKTTHRPVAQPRRQFVPTPIPDAPPVEELRFRAVLGRVRSPALAAVIAGLAYASPETWRAAQ